MSLDALAVDVSHAAKITLLNPKTRQPIRDADGKEAYIEVVSLDSPEVQNVQKAAINKRLKMRGRATVTADEIEAERAETLVAATKGWYLVTLDGAPMGVAFDAPTARVLYTDARFAWIREQVNEALDDRATFL
jgi:hypothetical protein